MEAFLIQLVTSTSNEYSIKYFSKIVWPFELYFILIYFFLICFDKFCVWIFKEGGVGSWNMSFLGTIVFFENIGKLWFLKYWDFGSECHDKEAKRCIFASYLFIYFFFSIDLTLFLEFGFIKTSKFTKLVKYKYFSGKVWYHIYRRLEKIFCIDLFFLLC